MAFPDFTWPRGGVDWYEGSTSSGVNVIWDIESFLRECQKSKKEIISPTLHFADANATWNFFTSFELEKSHSQFGVNFRPYSRVSDGDFDYYFDIKFFDYNDMEIKKIDFKLRVEKSSSADSHRAVKDFLSSRELARFLRRGCTCYITVRKSSIEDASPRAEIADSSSNSAMESLTRTQLLRDYSMAFPDSTWTLCDKLTSRYFGDGDHYSYTGWMGTWYLESFLCGCRKEKKEFRSPTRTFVDARWKFFASFDLKKFHSEIGINVQLHRLPNVVFDCCFDITFRNEFSGDIKNVKCELKSIRADSHWAVKNFLSCHELVMFLQCGFIQFSICVDKSSIKKAYQQTENEVTKECQDLKNFLLGEEGSDVTIQVRDQQFKAHRSILMARSSVFAAMFRHNMKEKATGVVNVEDCDPSSFPILLEFVYCGAADELSAENVFSLYSSADKYDVQGLKMKCFEFIKFNLSVNTFCETLKHSLQHPEANLSNLVVDFFAKNFKKIKITTEWQAFNLENPIQVNKIFTKAFVSDAEDD